MRANWREIWAENKILLTSLALVILFLLAFFWNRIFVLIDSGHAGVIFRHFRGAPMSTELTARVCTSSPLGTAW